jgi:hypothetical protein
MGTAAYGTGILKGLDVPGAIDLLTGFPDHFGEYDASEAHLAPGEQLEALLMLAAGAMPAAGNKLRAFTLAECGGGARHRRRAHPHGLLLDSQSRA